MDHINYLPSSLCLSPVCFKVQPACPPIKVPSARTTSLCPRGAWGIWVCLLLLWLWWEHWWQRLSELDSQSSWLVPPFQALFVHIFIHSCSSSGVHADPWVLSQNCLACANSQTQGTPNLSSQCPPGAWKLLLWIGYGLNCVSPKFKCWKPNPRYLRMSLFLEIGSF